MNAAEAYLKHLKDIHATGASVPETSYYGALEALFNEVGKSLSPKVRCVINLANTGAGIPDGGLFTADQFQRQSDDKPQPGQLPNRGAVEVKPASDDNDETIESKQVREQYLPQYGIVLVTNLREFVIVEQGPDGQPAVRERFTLADNASDFWGKVVAHPRKYEQAHGTEFFEFIQRACLHNTPLDDPATVAWFLASYAREALARVERNGDLPALQSVREGLEEALGMKFEGDKGEHFFRSTLVQTIFYGVFSAWVLWHKQNPGPGKFDWRAAEWTLHVPFIRALYDQLATPQRLGNLGLVEILERTAGVLNRVRRTEFFGKFAEDHAVQYFYEPFLSAFDPELRKDMGVWYTPPEIVKYQVARVDTALRDELGIVDGLADPDVIVLDPCCGTGAYLVEVIKHIAEALSKKGGDALSAHDLKQAAMNRVFGFEILPAPFVVSHLQLGLLLQELKAPLSHDKNERAGVYLTNALTGWQPPAEPKTFIFPELGEEHDAAAKVKRDRRILVVLGNPPYNAFAGVSPEEEKGLVEPYKEKLNKPPKEGGWGIKKFNLDELYVRFFRLAERRIAEMSGLGVVSFISNFSYLSDPSFVVMRERFLSEFDALWFDCLNGDSRETGKLTPAGLPDPSVFSTDYNREGIRVGTAVSVIVRREERAKSPSVRFRHFWGVDKRKELLQSLNASDLNAAYTTAEPAKDNRFSFRPESVSRAYGGWPLIVDLAMERPFAGVAEDRRKALIHPDKDVLEHRMQAYFSEQVSWNELTSHGTCLTEDMPRFDARTARAKLQQVESYTDKRLLRFALRPFDVQWCYYSPVRPLWREPRPDYWERYRIGSPALVTRFKCSKAPEGPPMAFARQLCDYHMMPPNASVIPTHLLPKQDDRKGQANAWAERKPRANLSEGARAYLAKLGFPDPDTDGRVAGLVWLHALAIGYSGAYLSENADGVRRDWPRIPLPHDRDTLEASADLGERVAALLDTEAEVPGVTSGDLESLFRTVGNLQRRDGEPLNVQGDDLAVTAGWGHGGDGKPVMPGKGKVERGIDVPVDASRADARDNRRANAPDTDEDVRATLLGEPLNVYLNDEVFWQNVPESVWDYHIGGYQVVKKWLSYREKKIIGRNLKPEEAREVTNTIRRLTALVLLGPQLDANYHACANAEQFTIPGPEKSPASEAE